MPDGYVYRAQQSCISGGCLAMNAAVLLEQAREVIRQNGREGMSQALWCDQGGHAFSERDTGRQRISVTVLDDDGAEQQEARDLCGTCATEAGLLKPRRTRTVPALTAAEQQAAAAEQVDDHEMLRQLQRELADLKAQKTAENL